MNNLPNNRHAYRTDFTEMGSFVVTQFFSSIESGFASHGKMQHFYVLVLGVKLVELMFVSNV